MSTKKPITTLDYPAILAKLRCNQDAWKKLDVRVSRSRFDAYERALVRLQKIVEQPALAKDLKSEEVGYFYMMLTDIYEFNEVSEWLLAKYGPKLGDRVRKVFSGPDLQSEEKDGSSGASRNTLFELLIAALVVQTGLKVDLTGITDVVTQFENHLVVIEAKRPLTRTGARSLVHDAVKQLEKRFAGGKGNSIGIIALSCSRIFTEGTKMARGISNAEVESALNTAHFELLSEVEVEFRDSQFVDAVIFYSKVVGSMERPELHGFISAYGNTKIEHPLNAPVAALFGAMNRAITTARN